jgi:hypothetical protein
MSFQSYFRYPNIRDKQQKILEKLSKVLNRDSSKSFWKYQLDLEKARWQLRWLDILASLTFVLPPRSCKHNNRKNIEEYRFAEKNLIDAITKEKNLTTVI